MKILIVTPVHTKINEHTLRCIYELEIPEGCTVDYYQPIWGYTKEDNKGNYDKLGRNNLKDKQNAAREIVLQCNYDYLLFVEEDMLIPSNTIQLLLDCNSDVAYGLYAFRMRPYMLSCWLGVDENTVLGISIDKYPETMRDYWNSIIDCDGIGFGCTLIHRSVLEKLSFRIGWYDKRDESYNIPHSDMWFTVDCIKNNIVQRHNLACKCGHINMIDGIAQIMYPDLNETVSLVRYIDYVNAFEDKNNATEV
jgi:hypothetical protein